MQAVKRLKESQVRWIVREKRKGNRTNAEIASAMKVSVSWVQKIARRYRGVRPADIVHLRPMGRPASTLFGRREHSAVLSAKGRLRHGAGKMEGEIGRPTGIHIPHNAVHGVLRDEELAERNPKKSRRRKWVRYERRYSNSMWHTDYASRYITGYGIFSNATSAHAIEVLREAVAKHGKPAAILTDRGAQFYAHELEGKKRGKTEFQKEIDRLGIRHILARVNHPQTNGKLERFHRELKKHLPSFEAESAMSRAGRKVAHVGGPFHALGPQDPIEMLIDWYNNDRCHASLDVDSSETPAGAFARKMAPKEVSLADVEAEEGAR